MLKELSVYTEYLDNNSDRDLQPTEDPTVFTLTVDKRPYPGGKSLTVSLSGKMWCSFLKLCDVKSIQLYLFMPGSVTLTHFQGHWWFLAHLKNVSLCAMIGVRPRCISGSQQCQNSSK